MCPVPSDTAHLRGAAAAHPSIAPSYRTARRVPPAARRAPAPLPPRGAPGGCCHLQLLPRHGPEAGPPPALHPAPPRRRAADGSACYVRPDSPWFGFQSAYLEKNKKQNTTAILISPKNQRGALIPRADRARASPWAGCLPTGTYFTSLILFSR